MKPGILSALWAILLTTSAAAEDSLWTTDYAKALEKAGAENKMVLLSFIQSDSSETCAKLQSDIYNENFFKEFAEMNLVLVKIDLTKTTTLPDGVSAQNEGLLKQYAVKDFPTVVVLNAKGAEIGRLGYIAGGPWPFVTELKKIKRKA